MASGTATTVKRLSPICDRLVTIANFLIVRYRFYPFFGHQGEAFGGSTADSGSMAGKRGDDADAEDDQQRPGHDPRSDHLHPL